MGKRKLNTNLYTIELLAPVRDEVSFIAAVEAGADAVYFGLGQVNMRLSSKGIDTELLPSIVRQAHRKNIKVYVTINAIIYDKELELLDELLQQVKQAQVDAVICWDFAVIQKTQKLGIPIHISTQASISNREALRFYEQLGAKRIVLARELSLEQIKEIKKNTRLQIETFVHGALCVAVSGRCFMSQFLSCHSANRGDCLQPCRREYRIIDTETGDELEICNGFVMSPKDLCTLPIIDQLIEGGIDAFKIEGRSRAPEYVKTVVNAYRRAIDAVIDGSYSEKLVNELMEEIAKVYNRGFSKGFLFGRPGPQDWSASYGSQATHKKLYVGKILNYYKKTKIAYGRITSQPLNVGDTVQVHGPTTGVVEFAITQLKTDKQDFVNNIDKGEVTFPSATLLRRNDQIFKIIPINIPAPKGS